MSAKLDSSLDRVVVLLGAALILAVAVVLLTSSSDGSPAAAKPASAVARVDHVDIADFKFAPDAISVAAGTTITWTNRDSAPHTATSGASASPDGTFDTDIIAEGQSKTVRLAKPGTFTYYCALHPFMHATVIVR
jgi:plastocyanin